MTWAQVTYVWEGEIQIVILLGKMLVLLFLRILFVCISPWKFWSWIQIQSVPAHLKSVIQSSQNSISYNGRLFHLPSFRKKINLGLIWYNIVSFTGNSFTGNLYTGGDSTFLQLRIDSKRCFCFTSVTDTKRLICFFGPIYIVYEEFGLKRGIHWFASVPNR